jgi:predicted nucleotidyltransferase
MLKEIKMDLTKNYKITLRDLKEKLVNELGDKLDSLILYGSVARGDFGPESDIDVLIIIENKELDDKFSDLRYDIDVKNGTVTTFIVYTPVEIENKVKQGFPFINNVLREGKIIYDNGTWARLHRSPVNAR